MKRTVLATLAFTLALGAGAATGLGETVLSDSKGGKPMTAFKPTTPKVFLTAKVKDATDDSSVKAVWVATKAEGAPPNYSIDQTDLKLRKGAGEVTFSMSKPDNGWPVGTYRVELFVNGKPAAKVPFSVAK